MLRRIIVGSIVLFVLGGCTASPIAFESYCDTYVEMACRNAERCGCFDPGAIGFCRSILRSDCQDEVESPVLSGRMTYDGSEAGSCISEVDAIMQRCSLDGVSGFPDACDRMLVGAIGEGGACESGDECVDGLECMDARCLRPAGEGAPCVDGACARDLYCGADDVCRRPVPLGETCGVDLWCADDLFCVSGPPQTCQPYPTEGQPCPDDRCADDLYCGADTRCRRYPTEGQPCAEGLCEDGLYYCDEASICQRSLPGRAACTRDEQCASYECGGGVCVEEDGGGECPFL